MVTREAGEEVWNQVLESSGVGDDVFDGMEGYDDSVTYSLVGAASDTLGVPASDVLEMFGVYWATEVAPKGYGDYFNAFGEGGGDETRSNPWLAELQQDMFIEVNPRDANNMNIRDGKDVWVSGPEGARIKVKAMVTERVGEGVAFMPFHFGGHLEGKDLRDKYPKGSDPYVLGESTNTVQTYGYDSVTQMQETKCTLCAIEPA